MSYGLHGRKKVALPPEVQEAYKIKEQKELKEYRSLCDKYFSKRVNLQYDEEFMLLTKDLLLQNPDFYSAWNDRRRALLESKNGFTSTKDNNDAYKIELGLVKDTLKIRPKTYWIWNHRLWALHKINARETWKEELFLTDYLLNLDSRNFHGWDYRRKVICELLKFEILQSESIQVEASPSPEIMLDIISKACVDFRIEPDNLLIKEFKYSESKIQQSFSNGSAWHYRSCLLKALLKNCSNSDLKSQDLIKSLISFEKEQSLVKNAFYTDPEDQSAWIYYRWLINSSLIPSQTVPISLLPHCYLIQKKRSQSIISNSLCELNTFDNSIVYEIVLTFPKAVCLRQDPDIQINFTELNESQTEVAFKFISSWETSVKSDNSFQNMASRTWRRYIIIEATGKGKNLLEVNLNLTSISDPSLDYSMEQLSPKGSVFFKKKIGLDPNNRSTSYIQLDRKVLAAHSFSPILETLAQKRLQFLSEEARELKELVDLEPTAKWPLLTLIFLNNLICEIYVLFQELKNQSDDFKLDVKKDYEEIKLLQRDYLKTLFNIDPLRYNFYRKQLSSMI